MAQIFLAGGCFWGVAEYFSRLPGVKKAIAGYANGRTEHPTYEEVCYMHTGHAETVQVVYDPQEISLQTLLEHFFQIINPLSYHRQGNDCGPQYRTGIYYETASDQQIAAGVMKTIQAQYPRPLAVELQPLRQFFPAEAYHQDYLKKHPDGYCHIPKEKFPKI